MARHGETTWKLEKRVLGSTPGELSLKGKEQAAGLSTLLANDAFTSRIAKFILDLKAHSAQQVTGIICHGCVMKRFNFLSDSEHFQVIQYPDAGW